MPPISHADVLRLITERGIAFAKKEVARALRRNSNDFDLLHLYGLINMEEGAFIDANRFFLKAYQQDPHFAPLLMNIANCQAKMGNINKAIFFYDKAIAQRKDYADAHFNKAVSLRNAGLVEKAIISVDHAVIVAPDRPEFHFLKGELLEILFRLTEAINHYEHSTQLDPSYIDAYMKLGKLYYEVGRFKDSVAAYKQVVLLDAENTKALSSLAASLAEAGDLENALDVINDAYLIEPRSSIVLNNRIAIHVKLGNAEAALVDYHQAVKLHHKDPDLHFNAGAANFQIGHFLEAKNCYIRVQELNPDYPELRWHLGQIDAITGNFLDAWPALEYRKDRKSIENNYHIPYLDKIESAAGKNVLVHWEQGMGDTIQFVPFLDKLNRTCKSVHFKPQRQLRHLLKGLIFDICLVEDIIPNQYDFITSLMSLPALFKSDLTCPLTRYLQPDVTRTELWARMLTSETFNIGICWQGSTGPIDAGRSFPLSLFENISRLKNVRLYSLHKGAGEKQLDELTFHVTTFGPEFDAGNQAFVDTCAVASLCDLVISSDTAVAHIAGALGKETWLALKRVPDWRWLLDRADSPWYPSMRLFRQKMPGDWQSVFAEIEKELLIKLERLT